MAIRDENQGNGIPQQGGPMPSRTSSPGWSFNDGGLFPSPIPKGIGSEYFNKLRDKLVETYKSANRDVEINVIEMSRAMEPALDFSCIIIATRLRDIPKIGVAFHILLLAETGEEIQPLEEQIYNNQTVMIHRVPSDAVERTLIDKAAMLVQKLLNVGPKELFFVDAEVIPKTFDPDNKIMMHNLAWNAGMACVTELNTRKPDFPDLNLAHLTKGRRATVDIVFSRQQLTDLVGNVFRSDLTITFSDRVGNDNRRDRQMNSGDKNTKFSGLSSFIDVLWFPSMDQTGGFGSAFMQPNLNQTQKFAARQVITDMQANYSQTPAAVLLALSTALCLRSPQNWVQAFKPVKTSHPSRNEIDITDVGALNIEGNIPVPQPNGLIAPDPSGFGKPIDTKADDFTTEQLGLYIAALFHRDLIIAMDVPEYGAQSHYLSMFSVAACGHNPNAITRILNAANELTGGEFQKHFKSDIPIFATTGERIHAGTWQDSKGQIRDIRDFDHIAVANLIGTRQPSVIKDWSDTFLRTEFPESQRLEARRNII
ncbi:MAG TPA: hypothetical protein VN843_17520, partial [Anaerolineales bacterium]|nr:hypothetical protein [Anaerolineales bacterium]